MAQSWGLDAQNFIEGSAILETANRINIDEVWVELIGEHESNESTQELLQLLLRLFQYHRLIIS